MSQDTMVEAIALSSPSGRMSRRARKAADERLRLALFGPDGLPVARHEADFHGQRSTSILPDPLSNVKEIHRGPAEASPR